MNTNSFYYLSTIEAGTPFCQHTFMVMPRGRIAYNGQYTQDRYCIDCNRRERWMRKAHSLTAAEKRAAKRMVRI